MRSNQTFIQTDDFDILLILEPHGWSDFYLFVEDKKFNSSITHVFTDPYSDVMDSLLDLIKEKNETQFIWYGEPGGCKFEIKTIQNQQHKAIISVYDFDETCGFELNFKLVMQFEVKIKHFILIFYLQLKKNVLLLNDKHFAKIRSANGLLQNFFTFEKAVIDFLQKKK